MAFPRVASLLPCCSISTPTISQYHPEQGASSTLMTLAYIHTYITGAYIALSNNMIKALYNEQIIIIIINYIYIALKTYF